MTQHIDCKMTQQWAFLIRHYQTCLFMVLGCADTGADGKMRVVVVQGRERGDEGGVGGPSQFVVPYVRPQSPLSPAVPRLPIALKAEGQQVVQTGGLLVFMLPGTAADVVVARDFFLLKHWRKYTLYTDHLSEWVQFSLKINNYPKHMLILLRVCVYLSGIIVSAWKLWWIIG